MKVNEVFASIQGEGPDAGIPAVFLRLQGCNVRCRWCDTSYALNHRDDIDTPLQAVIDKIRLLTRDNDIRFAVITGGEPLLQVDNVYKLIVHLHSDFRFAIETNGTQPVPSWHGMVMWDVDRKCPSSSVSEFNPQWYYLGKNHCRIKFVVEDENDLAFVIQELKQFSVRPTVLVSPVVNAGLVESESSWLQRVWSFCVENNLRYSLQVHKVVFGNKRGV